MSKVLGYIESVLTAVSVGAILVMVCLTSFDAAGRYILGTPIQAANEIAAKYCMVVAVFFGLCSGYHAGANIRVTFLANRFPRPVRLVTDHIVQILAAMCSIVLVISTFKLALRQLHVGMLDAPSIPVGPAYMASSFGLLIFTLWLLYDIPRVRKGKSDLLKEEDELSAPTVT